MARVKQQLNNLVCFFLSQFCGVSQSGNHPCEDLVTFGYEEKL
jgi:hypothetical protein